MEDNNNLEELEKAFIALSEAAHKYGASVEEAAKGMKETLERLKEYYENQ